MLNLEDLNRIIVEFSKSTVQSEAEVRSKFIVPLIEWLGYPVEYRAEEFPIHSFENTKGIKAKTADFLLFDDSGFASHRTNATSDLEWVRTHSLLIFEAKKAGQMPKTLEQPLYYSVFSKSVAYLISDGNYIKGRIYNPANSDADIIDCLIAELPGSQISLFSFGSISELKRKHEEMFRQIMLQLLEKSSQDTYCPIPVTEETIVIPDDLLQTMRLSLGKNAIGLSNLQLLEKYLVTTDYILENDIRYDVPPHMLQIPRKILRCKLYIDDIVLPFLVGEAWVFYRNEYDRISFVSSSITVDLLYKDSVLTSSTLSYSVRDTYVAKRLTNLQRVKKVLDSKRITLEIEETDKRSSKVFIETKQSIIDYDLENSRLSFWIDGMTNLSVIESYYGIVFKLGAVDPSDTFALYRSIDYVCRGIARQTNFHLELPGYCSDEAIDVDEPMIIEIDNMEHCLPSLPIHNFTFTPRSIYLPEGRIQPSKSPFDMDLCVVFEPVER